MNTSHLVAVNKVTISATDNLERLICAAIRQDVLYPTPGINVSSIYELLHRIQYHGVLPLLNVKLRSDEEFLGWPTEIFRASREAMVAQTIYELLHSIELARVFEQFDRRKVETLLLKGTGLAYSLYPNPASRPRSDTDLLVSPKSNLLALKILKELGYRRTGGPAGRFVGYQQQMQRIDERGIIHNIDLHWRISDLQSFAWLFCFEELEAGSLPVPTLGVHARRMGNVPALLHSLIHRAGNNLQAGPQFGDRLIWLYDIHLLSQTFTKQEVEDFCAIVENKRLGTVALDGLVTTADRFPSKTLHTLIQSLASGPSSRTSAEFLRSGRLRREWLEFVAVPGMYTRISYVFDRAFPQSEYMRERFPEASGTPLLLLHLRRWVAALERVLGMKRP